MLFYRAMSEIINGGMGMGMLSHEEIKKRLQGVDHQLCVAFAVRCSLRVLPLLVVNEGKEAFWYWKKAKRSQYLLATLIAQQNSTNFSVYGRKTSAAAVVTANIAADAAAGTSFSIFGKKTTTTTDAANTDAAAAAAAANAVASVAASARASATAVTNATAAADAAAVYADKANIMYIETAILQDLDRITHKNKKFSFLNALKSNRISPTDLMLSPLWSVTAPGQTGLN